MALKVQTYEKQCLQVEWTVIVPRVGMSAESPVIFFDNCDWIFKLVTKWNETTNDEMWTILFEKCTKANMFSKFLLAAHLRFKERGKRFIAQREITCCETEIWRCTHRLFLRNYPLAEFTGNMLAFVFMFVTIDYETLNYRDCLKAPKEDKSVQTPPYLDCLENLSLDLRNLMDEGSNPDVQLKCGDCTIPAHRVILGARSEVFRTMLQTDMVEGREGSVEIVDMEPNVFEIFLRYLYTGILPDLTEDLALPLYEGGDKYRLEALRGRCGDFLAENLNPENACEILVMADAHSDKDLKERVVFYILQEKIPDNDEEWTKFCDGHPKLAIEVFRRSYKQSLCS